MTYFKLLVIHQVIKTILELSCVSNILPFFKMEHFLSQIMMGKPEISVIIEPGFQTFSKNQLELREEELNQNHKQRIARDLEDT